MGCVQGTCRDRCAAMWCCRRRRYQPSSMSADADAAGFLTVRDTGSPERLLIRALSGRCGLRGSAPVPSAGVCLRYASLTQRGHYPDSPHRANQDSFCVRTNFQANPDLHFFGVFDGHGQFGAECAEFVSQKLASILSGDAHLLENPVRAYHSAFLATNSALHDSEIDDSMSGTTAITVLISGENIYVANVGDSRAVAGVWNGDYVEAEDLSSDQTPYRKDEYERVKLCGARVLCVDQVEGLMDPGIQSWGNEEDGDGDPPRLWVQNGMYPGTAFTRSVGDSTAENIGVIAVPEVNTVKITQNHVFFVVASDGIFEFLSSQAVVNMVSSFADPQDACSAIVAESYKLWLENENRTDDITVIVVQIKDMDNSDTATYRTRVSKNASRPGEVEAETQLASKFSTIPQSKRTCLNLQPLPPDSPVDPSPARVATSTLSI